MEDGRAETRVWRGAAHYRMAERVDLRRNGGVRDPLHLGLRKPGKIKLCANICVLAGCFWTSVYHHHHLIR